MKVLKFFFVVLTVVHFSVVLYADTNKSSFSYEELTSRVADAYPGVLGTTKQALNDQEKIATVVASGGFGWYLLRSLPFGPLNKLKCGLAIAWGLHRGAQAIKPDSKDAVQCAADAARAMVDDIQAGVQGVQERISGASDRK